MSRVSREDRLILVTSGRSDAVGHHVTFSETEGRLDCVMLEAGCKDAAEYSCEGQFLHQLASGGQSIRTKDRFSEGVLVDRRLLTPLSLPSFCLSVCLSVGLLAFRGLFCPSVCRSVSLCLTVSVCLSLSACLCLECKATKSDYIHLILEILHWLPVTHRIQYKVLTICFSSTSGTAPEYLSDLLQPYTPARQLRSTSDTRTFVSPRVNTETFGERSFSYAGPSVWNNLPQTLRHSHSASSFNAALKMLLFNNYF